MKNIKSFDEFLGEGVLDFFKSDVVDFTKPEKDTKKEKKGKGKWYDFLKDKEYRNMDEPTTKGKFQDKLDTIAKKYNIEEEEEEEEESTSYANKQEVHKAYQDRIARRKEIANRYKERKGEKDKPVNLK